MTAEEIQNIIKQELGDGYGGDFEITCIEDANGNTK